MPDYLYLDCASGISGDMFLGALLDLGLPLKDLNRDLAQLPVAGIQVRKQQVQRAGLAATRARVLVPDSPQPHRRLHDIHRMLSRAKLSPGVRGRALAVFTTLAEAEARVHGMAVHEIHFHEVGALDAIADVVGVMAGLERLGFAGVACSAVNVGDGTVASQHGLLPVPAPASLELLRGFAIVRRGPAAELVTPTGAALLAALVPPAGRGTHFPEGRLTRTGMGAGSRDFAGFSNCLRAWVITADAVLAEGDEVAVLTTNVDDATPQECGYVLEKLLETGALDAVYKPVQMKKNRPAQQLEVLCPAEKIRDLADLLFAELPTLGVRVSLTRRLCLPRRMSAVRLHGMPVRVKTGIQARGQITLVPEYEDAKQCARRVGLPLRQVLDEAREHARRAYERRK